ncbi:AGE family epimerase/isomerase [Egicoccus halophilus]|uniref:N-acylglucosamine 2-epimerase n=1 Tax=Egicoccus halophilus TaxID=1670830 RepID=A0A8J3EUX3_9ACTN|nr:AGE family epimerase/isomerase [Egicoccus halophilus]GGI08052.1 N-acylglucosamine 2-epimerase [Egicoccus halophilus]
MTAPIGVSEVNRLEAETERLLAFGRRGRHPAGGFAWLQDDGTPDLDRDVELWITCRMTHVYALGHLLGVDGAAELVDHGIAALAGRLHDDEHGGWYAAVGADGPTTPTKGAYEHAFVVLAATSAVVAQRPGAEAVLDEALAVQERHFFHEGDGAVVDVYLDRGFADLEDYRGANANMHTVEAYLAAADVTGDEVWLQRADRIVHRFVHGAAGGHGWRLPEHFDPDWRPRLDYHHDQPAHPFRPFGATVGHGFEWARLALHLEAARHPEVSQAGAGTQLRSDAAAQFRRAVEDGWSVDGAPGFVYTTDFDGTPVVRNRLHWVVNEATNAAAALYLASGEAVYADWYRTWWTYAEDVFVDREAGSWRHELDPDNRPAASVWAGKPDLYHAVQATLIPRLPLAPSLATALAEGRLDTSGASART